MPRGRPKLGSVQSSTKGKLRVIERKPIRPLERQRMRPWLLEHLDSGDCRQLGWYNKKDKTFRVSWKHAAGQTFDPDADATLFELWARHTGKYYTGDKPDPKKWKANFRCALHSLQDVDEDKSLGVKKGNNAYRVYRFLEEKKIKKSAHKQDRKQSSDEDSDEELAICRKGTKSRPKVVLKDDLDSEGSETGQSPAYESNNSDWEMPEVRGQDETEAQQHSPLPHFEQLCEAFAMPKPVVENERDVTDQLEIDEAVDNIVVYEDNTTDFDMAIILGEDMDLHEETVHTDFLAGPSVIVEPEGYYDFQSYTSLANVSL